MRCGNAKKRSLSSHGFYGRKTKVFRSHWEEGKLIGKPQSNRKIQQPKSAKPTEPKVGIIYLAGKKLLIDSTPTSKAVRHGDHLIHDPNHHQYWAQLVSSGAVPDEYEEHPRGRVAFNEKTGKYTLLADRCIIGKKSLVAKIVLRLNLPPKNTETGTDSHYRCFRCLGRGG